ncbi:ABC transporter family protein, partial [Vibrio parahaemolyticus VPTS-2010_2]
AAVLVCLAATAQVNRP